MRWASRKRVAWKVKGSRYSSVVREGVGFPIWILDTGFISGVGIITETGVIHD